MDTLATFLKEARTKSKLTQNDLAKKMGYSTPQFVSNWERGIAPFPVQKAKKFISLTRCDRKALEKAVIARFASRVGKYFA